MNHAHLPRLVVASIFCLAAAASVWAQSAKPSPRERELSQRLQMLQQDKTRLESERTETQGRLKAAEAALAELQEAHRSEAAALTKQMTTAAREKRILTDRAESSEREAERLRRAIDEQRAAFERERAEQNRLQTAERQRAEADLKAQVQVIARQSQIISALLGRVERLQGLGDQLLVALREQGMAASDPILRRGDVQAFENWQQMRDKLDAERSVIR